MAFDEEAGIAYEGYNAELSRAFLILRYYTDLDLTPYDTPQGRYEICDIIASHGLWPRIMEVVGEDISGVNAIVRRLEEAARRNFERKYSLDYRLVRLLEGLLGTESLVENIAKAESLNSRLIDMLGALRASPSVKAGVTLAKRRDAEDTNPAG